MRPYKYTKEGTIYIFHYRISDLRKFIKRGQEHGDAGMIIRGYDTKSKIKEFRGYGTIENPRKDQIRFYITHIIKFDGEFDADKIITPAEKSPINYSFFMIDFSSGTCDVKTMNDAE